MCDSNFQTTTVFIEKQHTNFTSFVHHHPISTIVARTITSILSLLHLEQQNFPSFFPFQFKIKSVMNPLFVQQEQCNIIASFTTITCICLNLTFYAHANMRTYDTTFIKYYFIKKQLEETKCATNSLLVATHLR